MQPAAAYPDQRITYRYPLKWLRQLWNRSAWDFVKKACSWSRTIEQSNGHLSSCSYIPLQISLFLHAKTLKPETARSSVPVLPREITMPSLSGIRSLKRYP